MIRKFLIALFGLVFLLTSQSACSAESSNHALAEELLAELVAVNTAPSGPG